VFRRPGRPRARSARCATAAGSSSPYRRSHRLRKLHSSNPFPGRCGGTDPRPGMSNPVGIRPVPGPGPWTKGERGVRVDEPADQPRATQARSNMHPGRGWPSSSRAPSAVVVLGLEAKVVHGSLAPCRARGGREEVPAADTPPTRRRKPAARSSRRLGPGAEVRPPGRLPSLARAWVFGGPGGRDSSPARRCCWVTSPGSASHRSGLAVRLANLVADPFQGLPGPRVGRQSHQTIPRELGHAEAFQLAPQPRIRGEGRLPPASGRPSQHPPSRLRRCRGTALRLPLQPLPPANQTSVTHGLHNPR